jgi:hypothetical protein
MIAAAGRLLALLAAAAAAFAAHGFVAAADEAQVGAALGVHVLAAFGALLAARLQGATGCECDLVLALALGVPGLGALSAFGVAARAPRANAHAAFEEEAAEAAPARDPASLERELRVTSHAHVLRHGSLEEKRNLLRRIARIGSPRYLSLVRRFLGDAEPELRLCAYAELARLAQQYEERIARQRAHAEALEAAGDRAAAEALAELAATNHAYAQSGLLDAEMGAYWMQQAENWARRGMEVDAACRAGQRVLALVQAERGDLDGAAATMADWPEVVDAACEFVRAEVAFRHRDLAACRASAQRLRAAGSPLPEWLAAAIGAPRAAARVPEPSGAAP